MPPMNSYHWDVVSCNGDAQKVIFTLDMVALISETKLGGDTERPIELFNGVEL